MPTTLPLLGARPRRTLLPELPAVSIFPIIGLIQLLVAVLTHGQWASFGEQLLW